MICRNTIQTNGMLVDDAWCRFFKHHNFLVGLSLDGPERFHDLYRRDPVGHGSFAKVVEAVSLLQRYEVDYNILAAVTSANAPYPREVYRFFRDTLGADYLQFIPIVVSLTPSQRAGEDLVTAYSVRPVQWGMFLKTVFDEWIHRDVGSVFIINFESLLARWLGRTDGSCIFSDTCGLALVLEHTGDVFACDHYVEPEYRLGNILETSLAEMVMSQRQKEFGMRKTTSLPSMCRSCEYGFACNGECPKNRLLLTSRGEPGLNYLCQGYRAFFAYATPLFDMLASLLRAGRPASDSMNAGGSISFSGWD
jgi:uncharacterized protein